MWGGGWPWIYHRLTQPMNYTERQKLRIPLQHVDTSDQRRWGHTQGPSSVPLFLTTPFLSPSPNLLTHSPLFSSLFFCQHPTWSSHSIPHLSVKHTFPLLFLPPFPCGLPHPFRSCVASTQWPAATWQSWREWHHHWGTGKRQGCFLLQFRLKASRKQRGNYICSPEGIKLNCNNTVDLMNKLRIC